ncbi:hypothetical protein Vi05172_g3593 [Venturia inaequalis]|nr:hypothetical protein Vi05172_g3593 [Venturia inaequalis]
MKFTAILAYLALATTTIAFALPQEEDRGKETAPCPKGCPRNAFDRCDCN